MILFFLYLAIALSEPNPDALRSFEEVCIAHGYQFETHNLTTSDGYILTLYRIPGKITETHRHKKPIVFLQHGLLDLADTWILNEPAPGFLLADAGLDVWLGNSRGSLYSLGHERLDYAKDLEYWQFTWMHMAEFDIPAMIDFVLSFTNNKKLTYIGHSQGTLQMFAYLSENPHFIDKISLFIALAPIASIKNIDVLMLQTLKSFPLFSLLEELGVNTFLPNPRTNTLFYEVCYWFGVLCNGIIEFLADVKIDEDNLERFPVIMSHEPGGTSILNMKHWQQMLEYQEYKVAKFDYGPEKNMEVYGNLSPPNYDLSKIIGPIALFSGTDDRFADVKDVEWLKSVLPKKSIVYDNCTIQAGHLTFLWGKDMTYFEEVIRLTRIYN